MKASEFIHWLGGYILDKKQLDQSELTVIAHQLDAVTEDTTPHIIHNPYIFGESYVTTGCKFPNNCALPTVWHGVEPPTCIKCGHQAPNLKITCRDES